MLLITVCPVVVASPVLISVVVVVCKAVTSVFKLSDPVVVSVVVLGRIPEVAAAVVDASFTVSVFGDKEGESPAEKMRSKMKLLPRGTWG